MSAPVIPHPALIEQCSGTLLIALLYWGRKWSEHTIASARVMAADGIGPTDAPEWATMLDQIEAALAEVFGSGIEARRQA